MIDLHTLNLTEPEQKFRGALLSGEECDLRQEGDDDMASWGEEHYIRADVVKAVLCVQPQGWRITADAPLDLKGAVIRGDLTGFDGIRLPSVRMEWCRFDNEVNFDRATFTSEARFDNSCFGDQARFAETIFESDARFDRTTFADAEFYKFTVSGDAIFYRARFTGQASLAHDQTLCARFRRARFKGDAQFRRARFDGDTSFSRAKFEGDAKFGAAGDEPSWVEEEERSLAAVFGGRAVFTHSCFDSLAGFKRTNFAGEAEFYQATFTGDADFYRATFTGSAQTRFERTTFKGNAEFRGAVFEGPARFPNAVFNGDASFGKTQTVKGARFAADADFFEASIASRADFCAATFDRQACFNWMRCAQITFKSAAFGANSVLMADGLRAEVLNLQIASRPQTLSLKDAQLGTIEDNEAAWPEDRCLTGCIYRRIQGDTDKGVETRIEWLKGTVNSYDPFRYDQLIAAYRLAGHETSANSVALAKQRERRRTLNRPGRIWGITQDLLVGYGYRLWLPVVWIVVLILLGSVVFGVGTDPEAKALIPDFRSLYYTTDLLFPVVNLGHKGNFEFQDWRLWLAYAFMLAGWLLAAAVLAGLQRLLSRQGT